MNRFNLIQSNGLVGFSYCLYLTIRHKGDICRKLRFLNMPEWREKKA